MAVVETLGDAARSFVARAKLSLGNSRRGAGMIESVFFVLLILAAIATAYVYYKDPTMLKDAIWVLAGMGVLGVIVLLFTGGLVGAGHRFRHEHHER